MVTELTKVNAKKQLAETPERIHLHCDSGQVEDLLHFILFRNKYNNIIRNDLFKTMQDKSSEVMSLTPQDKIDVMSFHPILIQKIYYCIIQI